MAAIPKKFSLVLHFSYSFAFFLQAGGGGQVCSRLRLVQVEVDPWQDHHLREQR